MSTEARWLAAVYDGIVNGGIQAPDGQKLVSCALGCSMEEARQKLSSIPPVSEFSDATS